MAPQPTVEVLLIENPLLEDYTTITHEGTKLLCHHFKEKHKALDFVHGWIMHTKDFDCPITPTSTEGNIMTWIATRK